MSAQRQWLAKLPTEQPLRRVRWELSQASKADEVDPQKVLGLIDLLPQPKADGVAGRERSQALVEFAKALADEKLPLHAASGAIASLDKEFPSMDGPGQRDLLEALAAFAPADSLRQGHFKDVVSMAQSWPEPHRAASAPALVKFCAAAGMDLPPSALESLLGALERQPPDARGPLLPHWVDSLVYQREGATSVSSRLENRAVAVRLVDRLLGMVEDGEPDDAGALHEALMRTASQWRSRAGEPLGGVVAQQILKRAQDVEEEEEDEEVLDQERPLAAASTVLRHLDQLPHEQWGPALKATAFNEDLGEGQDRLIQAAAQGLCRHRGGLPAPALEQLLQVSAHHPEAREALLQGLFTALYLDAGRSSPEGQEHVDSLQQRERTVEAALGGGIACRRVFIPALLSAATSAKDSETDVYRLMNSFLRQAMPGGERVDVDRMQAVGDSLASWPVETQPQRQALEQGADQVWRWAYGAWNNGDTGQLPTCLQAALHRSEFYRHISMSVLAAEINGKVLVRPEHAAARLRLALDWLKHAPDEPILSLGLDQLACSDNDFRAKAVKEAAASPWTADESLHSFISGRLYDIAVTLPAHPMTLQEQKAKGLRLPPDRVECMMALDRRREQDVAAIKTYRSALPIGDILGFVPVRDSIRKELSAADLENLRIAVRRKGSGDGPLWSDVKGCGAFVDRLKGAEGKETLRSGKLDDILRTLDQRPPVWHPAVLGAAAAGLLEFDLPAQAKQAGIEAIFSFLKKSSSNAAYMSKCLASLLSVFSARRKADAAFQAAPHFMALLPRAKAEDRPPLTGMLMGLSGEARSARPEWPELSSAIDAECSWDAYSARHGRAPWPLDQMPLDDEIERYVENSIRSLGPRPWPALLDAAASPEERERVLADCPVSTPRWTYTTQVNILREQVQHGTEEAAKAMIHSLVTQSAVRHYVETQVRTKIFEQWETLSSHRLASALRQAAQLCRSRWFEDVHHLEKIIGLAFRLPHADRIAVCKDMVNVRAWEGPAGHGARRLMLSQAESLLPDERSDVAAVVLNSLEDMQPVEWESLLAEILHDPSLEPSRERLAHEARAGLVKKAGQLVSGTELPEFWSDPGHRQALMAAVPAEREVFVPVMQGLYMRAVAAALWNHRPEESDMFPLHDLMADIRKASGLSLGEVVSEVVMPALNDKPVDPHSERPDEMPNFFRQWVRTGIQWQPLDGGEPPNAWQFVGAVAKAWGALAPRWRQPLANAMLDAVSPNLWRRALPLLNHLDGESRRLILDRMLGGLPMSGVLQLLKDESLDRENPASAAAYLLRDVLQRHGEAGRRLGLKAAVERLPSLLHSPQEDGEELLEQMYRLAASLPIEKEPEHLRAIAEASGNAED